MARFRYIVVGLVSLMFSSCGQVGSITGGDIDNTAPRVIADRVVPPAESTTIFPDKIIIPFDEFIEFNKPLENIRVTPADVKLNYAINNKSVVLSVKSGEWLPNTTYTIYLNRAVKDITEANDSIIAYVFSTGSFLDSLKTAVQVEDAFTGKPVSDVTVGLFTQKLIDDTNKVEPRYYAATDEKGIASFQFIKDTTFFIYAFEDDNLNNRLDPTEKRAVLNSPAKLDTVSEIGSIIRLMPPEDKYLRILSNEVIPTATWCLAFNRPLEEEEKFVFLAPKPLHVIWNEKKDSLSAFYGEVNTSGTYIGVLESSTNQDTITKKFFFKDKNKLHLEVSNNLSKNKLLANDTLKLKFNEPILTLNKDQIILEALRIKDTIRTPLEFNIFNISPNEISLSFDKNNIEKVFLSLPQESVECINHKLKDSLKLDFTLQKEKETGVMVVEFDTIPSYGILVITNLASNEIDRITFDGNEKKSHRIEFMQPGEYSFYYIYDENKDGSWTVGSIFEEKEAEIIHWFNTTSTIRANWEVKKVLELKELRDKSE